MRCHTVSCFLPPFLHQQNGHIRSHSSADFPKRVTVLEMLRVWSLAIWQPFISKRACSPQAGSRGKGHEARRSQGCHVGGSDEPSGGWHGMVAASLPSVPPAFSLYFWLVALAASWPLLGLPLSQSSLQGSGCWVLWMSSNICSSPHRCLTVGLRVWAPVLGSAISLLLLWLWWSGPLLATSYPGSFVGCPRVSGRGRV